MSFNSKLALWVLGIVESFEGIEARIEEKLGFFEFKFCLLHLLSAEVVIGEMWRFSTIY